MPLVQELRPGVVERRARPLQPVLLDPRVADPVPVRREVGQLVPDRLRVGVLGPVAAERAGEVDHDLAVAARVPGQRHGGAHAVDPPLGVRERAVLLREARGGEDDVREACRGVVQEQVLRDDELELGEPLLDVVRVRLGLRRVLADQVERLDPVVVEAGHHLVEPVAGALGQVDAPRLGELLAAPPGRPRAGSRGSSAGSRPSRSGPGRCSGRAARSARSTRSRDGRSSGRGSRATRCCRRRRRAR